ncbi:hypothetical protein D3C76_1653610 [compost metagenome]
MLLNLRQLLTQFGSDGITLLHPACKVRVITASERLERQAVIFVKDRIECFHLFRAPLLLRDDCVVLTNAMQYTHHINSPTFG